MLVQDKFTGKSRGFAFVTMSSDTEAQKAIKTCTASRCKVVRSP